MIIVKILQNTFLSQYMQFYTPLYSHSSRQMLQYLEPEKRIYLISTRDQYYSLSNNCLYQLDRNYNILKQHTVNFPYYLGFKHPEHPHKILSDKPQHYIVHKIYGRYHVFVFDMIYIIELEGQKYSVSKIFQKNKSNEEYYNQLTTEMKMLYNHNQFFVTHNNFIIQNQLNQYLQLDNKPFDVLSNYTRSHNIDISFIMADVNANNYLIKITKQQVVKIYIDQFHSKKLMTYQLTGQNNILLFQENELLILDFNETDVNFLKSFNPDLRPILTSRYDGLSKFHRLLYVNINQIPAKLLYHPYFFSLKDITKVSHQQLQELCEIDLYSVLALTKSYANNYFSIDVSRLRKSNIISFVTQYISNYRLQNNLYVQQHYNRILKYCDYKILTDTIYQYILKLNSYMLEDNDAIYIFLYQLVKRGQNLSIIKLVENILSVNKSQANIVEMLIIDLTYNRVNIQIMQTLYDVKVNEKEIYSFAYQTIFFCLTQRQIDRHSELKQQVTIFNIFEQEKEANIIPQLKYYQTNQDFQYAAKIAIINTAALPAQNFEVEVKQQGIKFLIIIYQMLQVLDNSDEQIITACESMFKQLENIQIAINPLIFRCKTQEFGQLPLQQQFYKILLSKFLNQKIGTTKDLINVMSNTELFYQYIDHNADNQQNYIVEDKHLFQHFLITHQLSNIEKLIDKYQDTPFLQTYHYQYIKQMTIDHNFQLVMMLIKAQTDFNQYSQIILDSDAHQDILCTYLATTHDRFGQCLIRKYYLQVPQIMQQKIVWWCYWNGQLDKLEDGGYFSVNKIDIFGRTKADIHRLLQISKIQQLQSAVQ